MSYYYYHYYYIFYMWDLPISCVSDSQCMKQELCRVSHAETWPLLVETNRVLSPAYTAAVKSTWPLPCSKKISYHFLLVVSLIAGDIYSTDMNPLMPVFRVLARIWKQGAQSWQLKNFWASSFSSGITIHSDFNHKHVLTYQNKA